MLEIIGLIVIFFLTSLCFALWQQKVFNKALQESGKSFFDKHENQHRLNEKTLQDVVNPLKDSLSKFERQIQDVERQRIGAYSTLTENLRSLSTTQFNLEKETKNLVKALRAPHVRGLWGEIQLKRVVELAGMLEYCDFLQQEVIGETTRLRPDMIIKLPGDRSLIVDSKTPLSAYLEAVESTDEIERVAKLKEHAKQIRTHINQLSTKSYYSQLKVTPEFVILFIPGEPLFSAALEQDPSLIEYSTQQNVIIATPITLIALLRAIAHSWRHEQIAKNALQITELGKHLHERLFTFLEHYQDMKKGIDKTIESYNKSVVSLETRVLVSARKLKEMAAHQSEELPTMPSVEKAVIEPVSVKEYTPV